MASNSTAMKNMTMPFYLEDQELYYMEAVMNNENHKVKQLYYKIIFMILLHIPICFNLHAQLLFSRTLRMYRTIVYA